MAGTDASEGQALWQSGGAEEDSRLREGNRHLHLAYGDEEGVQRLGHSFGEGRAWRRVKMYACSLHQTVRTSFRGTNWFPRKRTRSGA